MARIFMDGFEHGRPTAPGVLAEGDYNDSLWQFKQRGLTSYAPGNSGGIGVDNTVKNGGDYSISFYKTVGNASGLYRLYELCLYKQLPSTYNKLFFRSYIYVDTISAGTEITSLVSLGQTAYGNTSMQLRYHIGNRTLYLYVNGSSVASIGSVLLSQAWQLLEIMYDYSSSNIVVKLDNSEVINYSGSIDSAIEYVSLGKSDSIENDGYGTFQFYIDDFALNDDSGSVNNSWIGAGVVRLLTPTSDDTNADFTPSAGSDHYALVDDFPDDGDTTYNSSSVSGDIDTFGLESVPSVATGQTINAVQAVYRARSETDAGSVAPILISGATTDTGDAQSTVLSDYYDTKQETYDLDPNTSAQWTEANINAVKGGYKNAT